MAARPEWTVNDVLRLTVRQINYLLTKDPADADGGTDASGELEFQPDGTVVFDDTIAGRQAWAQWQAAHGKGSTNV